MSRLLRYAALLVLLSAMSGCSSVKEAKDQVTGWIGGDSAAARKENSADSSGPVTKYAATLRVGKYIDQRKSGNPRFLGIASTRVVGIDGDQILLDQEISDIVTAAIKKRFVTEGYDVLEGSSANAALFEVSGTIKEMTLNVKARDEINIAIETTIKEVSTGKVVWSGIVVEKNDRYAGTSGNNKDDVVDYMNKILRVACSKTVTTIGASLMASRPELFNLTPGTKPVPGVTVYVAPPAAQSAPASPAAPVPGHAQPGGNAPPPAYAPRASATAGLLLVNTNPPRAKVYVAGVYYGLSPLRLEMEPGVYAISVKLDGYRMSTEKVSVRKGDNTEVELNLER